MAKTENNLLKKEQDSVKKEIETQKDVITRWLKGNTVQCVQTELQEDGKPLFLRLTTKTDTKALTDKHIPSIFSHVTSDEFVQAFQNLGKTGVQPSVGTKRGAVSQDPDSDQAGVDAIINNSVAMSVPVTQVVTEALVAKARELLQVTTDKLELTKSKERGWSKNTLPTVELDVQVLGWYQKTNRLKDLQQRIKSEAVKAAVVPSVPSVPAIKSEPNLATTDSSTADHTPASRNPDGTPPSPTSKPMPAAPSPVQIQAPEADGRTKEDIVASMTPLVSSALTVKKETVKPKVASLKDTIELMQKACFQASQTKELLQDNVTITSAAQLIEWYEKVWLGKELCFSVQDVFVDLLDEWSLVC